MNTEYIRHQYKEPIKISKSEKDYFDFIRRIKTMWYKVPYKVTNPFIMFGFQLRLKRI